MNTRDFDLLRQRLEEQFRADVQLLYEGHCAKLRALEAVFLAEGRLDPARLPSLTFGVGGLLPALQLALRAALPATPAAAPTTPAPLPAAPPADERGAAGADSPAKKEKRRRWEAHELRDGVLAALEQVGKEFDRVDLARVIGGAPARSTLHRLLSDLEREGRVALVKPAQGRKPDRYRRVDAAGSSSDSEPET